MIVITPSNVGSFVILRDNFFGDLGGIEYQFKRKPLPSGKQKLAADFFRTAK
jgi:hypothetical protein